MPLINEPIASNESLKGGTRQLRNRKFDPSRTHSRGISENVVDNNWYTSDEMMEKIRNDHSLGLDSLYRTNIKHEETNFRIVAPFIEHALNPPKKPKKAADDIYDKSAASKKEPHSGIPT